jgi:O-antigen/teichoic acid export membrane protein
MRVSLGRDCFALLMKKELFKKGIANGIAFIASSGMIAGWYFLCTQHYDTRSGVYLLLAVSTSAIINLLDLGLSLALIHILSTSQLQHRWSREFVVFSSLGGSLLMQLAGGPVIFYTLNNNESSFQGVTPYLLVTLFAVFTQAVQTAVAALKGLLNFRAANTVLLLSTTGVYGFSVIVLIAKASPQTVFGLMVACQGLASAYAIRVLLGASGLDRSQSPTTRLTEVLRCYAFLVRRSISFFPQIFSGIFFLHIQRFFVMELLGARALANFSFAYALASRVHAVINSFFDIAFPYAATLSAKYRLSSLGVVLGSGAALACLLALLVLGVIIDFIAPKVLVPYAIYGIGVVFAMASAPAFHLLNGLSRPRFVSICSLLAPVIFFVIVVSYMSFMKAFFPAEVAGYVIPGAYAVAMAVLMTLSVGSLRKLKHS